MYTSFGPDALGIDRSFPEAAQLASTHGFDGIQVDLSYLTEHGPDAYRDVLTEHGLKNGSLDLPFRFDAAEAEYDAELEAFEEIASNVAEIGCTRCSTYILPYSEERSFDEQFDFSTTRLGEIAEILDGYGIDFGLEFVGPQTMRDGNEHVFVYNTEGMLELCSAIPADNVGLLLDSWHWYTAGDTVETLESLDADDIVDVHVNDAPSGVGLEEHVDTVRRLSGTTGVIDIESFLGHLEAIGYDGPVMAEPFSDEVNGMSDEEAAEATRESMAKIWESAGI